MSNLYLCKTLEIDLGTKAIIVFKKDEVIVTIYSTLSPEIKKIPGYVSLIISKISSITKDEIKQRVRIDFRVRNEEKRNFFFRFWFFLMVISNRISIINEKTKDIIQYEPD